MFYFVPYKFCCTLYVLEGCIEVTLQQLYMQRHMIFAMKKSANIMRQTFERTNMILVLQQFCLKNQQAELKLRACVISKTQDRSNVKWDKLDLKDFAELSSDLVNLVH